MAKIKGTEWEVRPGSSTWFILEILCPVESGKSLGDYKQVNNVIGFVFQKEPLESSLRKWIQKSFPNMGRGV